MPAGAFYGQEGVKKGEGMGESDSARQVRIGIKTGAYYGQARTARKVLSCEQEGGASNASDGGVRVACKTPPP